MNVPLILMKELERLDKKINKLVEEKQVILNAIEKIQIPDIDDIKIEPEVMEPATTDAVREPQEEVRNFVGFCLFKTTGDSMNKPNVTGII